MELTRNVVIYGAGKIGRGFIGDLFNEAGYEMTFIDVNETLVSQLRKQKYYTLYNLKSEEHKSKKEISNFTVLHTDQHDEVEKVLLKTSIMAVSLFPEAFEAMAEQIVKHIEYRKIQKDAPNLNILICANIHHPAPLLSSLIEKKLSNEGRTYFLSHVGLIETLVIRMAVQPKKYMLEEDPLVIMTNGYEELTVDKSAFVTELPNVPGLRFTDKIRVEEIRKMYTYNMVHAVLAYTGRIYGYITIEEAIKDNRIMTIVHGALNEIGNALISGYGFTSQEMKIWNKEVIENMSNPILGDTIERVGSNPKRKLAQNDRLIGPAIICRSQGIYPYYLATAIACAYMYINKDDTASIEIQDYLAYYPIEKAIAYYSEISDKPDLIALISANYKKISSLKLNFIMNDIKRISIIAKAYNLGFFNEKTIKGCAQCAIKALGELSGNPQELIFKAASGLSGGIAITGDGSCGGYIGGVMLMGSYVGRRLTCLDEGDKEAQYTSYAMAQSLHDHYLQTYGSVTCSDIHKVLFGKDFCLRTKAVRNEFEQAGGHDDTCTSVIANASAWIAEILLDEHLLNEEGVLV